MVDQQLRRRGIHDERVLSAMFAVPRHAFVTPAMQYAAYEDRALPIGEGQTISQPYMVARASELAALTEGEHALNVGAGSGYQASVLAHQCERVVAIELVEKLAEQARRSLEAHPREERAHRDWRRHLRVRRRGALRWDPRRRGRAGRAAGARSNSFNRTAGS